MVKAMEIIEGNLKFIFEKNIKTLNYDEEDSFYVNKFQSILKDKNELTNQEKFNKICKKYKKKEFKKELSQICPKSISAVDIIAYDKDTAYFIEVKDYRNPRSEEKNLNNLVLTVIKNCLDSYAGVMSMKFSKKPSEQTIAKEIINKEKIEFILHIEIPRDNTNFDREVWNLEGIQDLIEKKNNFSYRIRVVSMDNLPKSLPWSVKDINATP